MGEWLQSLIPWGTEAIVWVQSYSTGWLDSVFTFFTYLGYEQFYLVLLPFIYWCLDRRTGAGLAFISLLTAWINTFIKYLFDLPRPDDPRIRVPLPEESPSFPSGHAQSAVVNWGYLVYRLRNWRFWIVAVIAVVGIGLSRIVLGVHFPQDVVGGWLIGLAILLLYIWAEPKVSSWVEGQPVTIQLVLAIGVPLLLIFAHPADPEGGYPAELAVTPMSTLAGLGIGVIMERKWVGFEVWGLWWKRGLRYLLGLVIVLPFYVGLKLLVPEGMAHGPDVLLRFGRYALLGWAAAFLCPWIFVRLRLAEQATS